MDASGRVERAFFCHAALVGASTWHEPPGSCTVDRLLPRCTVHVHPSSMMCWNSWMQLGHLWGMCTVVPTGTRFSLAHPVTMLVALLSTSRAPDKALPTPHHQGHLNTLSLQSITGITDILPNTSAHTELSKINNAPLPEGPPGPMSWPWPTCGAPSESLSEPVPGRAIRFAPGGHSGRPFAEKNSTFHFRQNPLCFCPLTRTIVSLLI